MGVDDGRERQELFFRAHSKCKDLWTLESEAKICFWVITVNLTRHWRTQENMEAMSHDYLLPKNIRKSCDQKWAETNQGRRKNKERQRKIEDTTQHELDRMSAQHTGNKKHQSEENQWVMRWKGKQISHKLVIGECVQKLNSIWWVLETLHVYN